MTQVLQRLQGPPQRGQDGALLARAPARGVGHVAEAVQTGTVGLQVT